MTDKPIYKPKGKAGEYAEYAVNIYTGCPHGCAYCYSPRILRKTKEEFANCKPRKDIAESVKRQLKRTGMRGEVIHLCFTCDPYPVGMDTSVTREVIEAIKESGNHVQILTKGRDARKDFDLLDENDWFGITLTGADAEIENAASESERIKLLAEAKSKGIKTWVSYEPVIDQMIIKNYIFSLQHITDKVKIGKPNGYEIPVDKPWGQFGQDVEDMCVKNNIDYYIKDTLREEMGD